MPKPGVQEWIIAYQSIYLLQQLHVRHVCLIIGFEDKGLGLYSLSAKTSYRQISRSLETAGLDNGKAPPLYRNPTVEV